VLGLRITSRPTRTSTTINATSNLGACLAASEWQSSDRPNKEIDDPRLEGLEPAEPPASHVAPSPRGSTSNRVWDIGWVDGHAALVRDDAQYERWDVVRQHRLVRVEGKGARQLLGAYVNVVDDYDASCTLMRISTEGLTPAKHFDRAYSFSVDADVWMLARDVGRTDEARRDLLLTPLLEEVWSGALGHYDCFNHYVRVDGRRGELFFLRGTPANQHTHKQLVAIDHAGLTRVVMAWDAPDGGAHLKNGAACGITPGDDVAVSAYTHDYCPGRGEAFVARRSTKTGGTRWRQRIAHPPIALAHVPAVDSQGDRVPRGAMAMSRVGRASCMVPSTGAGCEIDRDERRRVAMTCGHNKLRSSGWRSACA